MPIADTPLEQLVVALATKWTGEEPVLLLVGEETDTPANEQTDSMSTTTRIFIFTPAKWPQRGGAPIRAVGAKHSQRDTRQIAGNFSGATT
jgi:hypothetical protein